jgi:spore maturation protein CgeB
MNSHPLTIGFLGSQRRGSDPRALACAMRSMGHLLIEYSYDEFLPQQWRHPALKAVRRILRPFFAADYNRSVLQLLGAPLDFLLVFKGMLLDSRTLLAFREREIPCYLFYPDVSFKDHGDNILDCLPLYDHIFTTKEFHLSGDSDEASSRRMTLVKHGADPEVHRPIDLSDRMVTHYSCDVSFVGCWSPKKERHLITLLESLPGINLRIWGGGWERACLKVRASWTGRGAWGDELALIYRASKINLGLLSEAGGGVNSGDLTTARTWQIPASGGFLLHEDTKEFRNSFVPECEAAVFASLTEMVRQVERFLVDGSGRSCMAAAGRERWERENYSYEAAAGEILRKFRIDAQKNR